MITEVILENVKSIKDATSIKLAPLTLFIGENGSGKSTFLQMLSLLSQNPTAPSLQDGQIISLGGFDELVNDAQKPIVIQLKGNITLDVDDFPYMKNFEYSLSLFYNKQSQNASPEVIFKLETRVNELLRVKLGLDTDTIFFMVHWKQTQGIVTIQHMFYDVTDDDKFAMHLTFQPPFHFRFHGWVNRIGNQDKQQKVARFLNSISMKMMAEFENISYVPALRGIDTRTQPLQHQITRHPVNAFNFNNQSQLLSTALAYNRDLENIISSLIESILDRKCRCRVQQGLLVAVETFNGNKWVNIMNEGFGVNPLVQLSYQLAAAPKNSIILIEEPEIHVFPAAQKRMIANIVKFTKNENKHLIITTHSAHVYSILLKYKERKDSDVKMYYFNRNPETRVSKVTEINESNRNGILQEFLSTDISEVADIIEAGGV